MADVYIALSVKRTGRRHFTKSSSRLIYIALDINVFNDFMTEASARHALSESNHRILAPGQR